MEGFRRRTGPKNGEKKDGTAFGRLYRKSENEGVIGHSVK